MDFEQYKVVVRTTQNDEEHEFLAEDLTEESREELENQILRGMKDGVVHIKGNDGESYFIPVGNIFTITIEHTEDWYDD